MKKILLTIALMCTTALAHAMPMGGDYYGSSFEQPLAETNRYQVDEVVVERQGALMLRKVKDLKANIEFYYWVTEQQLEQGQDGQTVFLKADVIPAGA